ncbi:hypothetical protein Q9L58_000993 [Maublancomyces gigas]|uniref:Uncharacterized protein n=1 Tax=Discina gigas TaxID=1032678 RepID=A0ABR3GVE0_9PEZI
MKDEIQDLRRYALLHGIETKMAKQGISLRFPASCYFAKKHIDKHSMLTGLRDKLNALPPSPLRMNQSRFDGSTVALIKNSGRRRARRAPPLADMGIIERFGVPREDN